MKDKNQARKPTAQEKKANFIKWYVDDRKPFFEDLKGSIRPIILIPLCTIIALYTSICFIGDGLYKYDERTYKAMERAIEYAIVQGTGIDSLPLQTKDLYLDDLYTSSGPDAENFIYFDEKASPDTPRKMTTVDSHYDIKTGQTILTCTVKDGFFNAKVTTKLNEQHQFVEWSRNFPSFNLYKLHFWGVLGTCTIAGGALLYLAIEGIRQLYWKIKFKLFDTNWKVKFKLFARFSKKKSNESDTPVDNPQIEAATIPGLPVTGK